MELMRISRREFSERFRLSPIRRCGYAGFLRNVAIALGNSGLPETVPALTVALHHPESLVRRHGAWALGRIGGREAGSETAAGGPDRVRSASQKRNPAGSGQPGVQAFLPKHRASDLRWLDLPIRPELYFPLSGPIIPHFSPGGAIMAQAFFPQRVLGSEERSGHYGRACMDALRGKGQARARPAPCVTARRTNQTDEELKIDGLAYMNRAAW